MCCGYHHLRKSGDDERKTMMKLTANYFSSSFIRNDGNGKFTIQPLPDVAQFSVINGMIAEDFDGDGNLDVFMSTNDYGTEVGNGRYDALNGLVLKGDGKGGFTPLSILQSGVCIGGDGKGLCKLKGANDTYLIAATQNKGPVQLYKSKKPIRIIGVKPGDLFAVLSFKDGKKQKTECYYGSSFLSQGSRFITVPANVVSCLITDVNGKTREVLQNK